MTQAIARVGPVPLSERPRRRGKIYCSPFCGGGCTWAAYKEAYASARATAKFLGRGWQVKVSENLGWHWIVISPGGYIRLWHSHYYSMRRKAKVPGDFVAVCGNHQASGRSSWAAIFKVLAEVRAVRDGLTDVLRAEGAE